MSWTHGTYRNRRKCVPAPQEQTVFSEIDEMLGAQTKCREAYLMYVERHFEQRNNAVRYL